MRCVLVTFPNQPYVVGIIPKLGKSWKVIFDLLVEEYDEESHNEVSLLFTKGTAVDGIEDDEAYCRVIFTNKRATMVKEGKEFGVWEDDHEIKIGDWNRIELTQEEGEDGRFSLSLAVGGFELGRLDVGNLEQEKFTDVVLDLSVDIFPVFIRRFLVVDKC